MSNLSVGMIVEWISEQEDSTPLVERILWVNPTATDLVSIQLDEPLALPVWKRLADIEEALSNGSAIIRVADPYAHRLHPPESFLLKHRQRRDAAWKVIEDMVSRVPDIYDEKIRGGLVADAANQHSVHKMTVYKYLRRFWWGGMVKNALLPSYERSGGPGKEKSANSASKRGRPTKATVLRDAPPGINVDDSIRRIFSVAFRLYVDTNKAPTLKRAYSLMLSNYFNVGFEVKGGVRVPVLPPSHQLPTLEQFRYWYKKQQDIEASFTKREGARRFALKRRPVLGSSTKMAFGPGSIYQIDATIADVYLVSSLNRSQIIGRPVVYVIIDALSRMITGLYVGLEGPSWLGAMMALANATSDKKAFCRKYGISISDEDWPCKNLPMEILADRGELLSRHADELTDSLNITVANAPPFRADWKGIVEQQFRIANERVIHWVPGAVRRVARERGDLDYRLDAKLDLNAFTEIMIYNTLSYNKMHWMEWYRHDEFQIQSAVDPFPRTLWNWGIEHRSGFLRTRPQETVLLALMPRGEASVTHLGIKWQGLYYTSEIAVREQWFIRARATRTWKVSVAYDPRNIEMIYIIQPKGGIEACHLLEKNQDFAGYMVEEVQDYVADRKLRKAEIKTDILQERAEFMAQVDAVVTAQENLTEGAVSTDQSNHKRVKDIRQNRREERERVRKAEAWELAEHPGTPRKIGGGSQSNASASSSTVESRKRGFLNILKQTRKIDEPDNPTS